MAVDAVDWQFLAEDVRPRIVLFGIKNDRRMAYSHYECSFIYIPSLHHTEQTR